MRYFVPRLKFGPFSPPQDRLEDKFGGLAWGLPASLWPVCSHCGKPQSLIAQLSHHDDRLDLGKPGRVLHVFQCGDWVDGNCDTWEPGSGANACFTVEGTDLGSCLSPAPLGSAKPGVESRVLEWIAKDDGLDVAQYAACFEESSWLDLSEEIRRRILFGTKLGGAPGWSQAPHFSLPPEGLGDWRFLLQVSDALFFEGPPQTPDEVGCRVVRQVYEMDGERLVRARVSAVDEPQTTKADAPDAVVHHVNDNTKSACSGLLGPGPVAQQGLGCMSMSPSDEPSPLEPQELGGQPRHGCLSAVCAPCLVMALAVVIMGNGGGWLYLPAFVGALANGVSPCG